MKGFTSSWFQFIASQPYEIVAITAPILQKRKMKLKSGVGTKGEPSIKRHSTSQLVRGRVQIPTLRLGNSKPHSRSLCYKKLFRGASGDSAD